MKSTSGQLVPITSQFLYKGGRGVIVILVEAHIGMDIQSEDEDGTEQRKICTEIVVAYRNNFN